MLPRALQFGKRPRRQVRQIRANNSAIALQKPREPMPASSVRQEPAPATAVSAGKDASFATHKPEDWTVTLLKWALLFFVISVVAGILGFTGISAASADVARILFYIFLVIFLVLLILGLTIFRV
jgi:uncharacterized membrane protein YtjA (UPF0391 family)